MNKQKNTLLVISPHPDDLEIAMSGTVAKAVTEGREVISIVLTDGRRSQRSFACSDDEMASIRQQEVKESANILGIQQLHCLALTDLYSSENQQILLEFLYKLIINYQPQEIYIPHPTLDKHKSHQIAAQLSLEVINKAITNKTLPHPNVWAYEVWGLFSNWDITVDISDFVVLKRAAINCHKSQVTDIAYADGVLGLNRWRGVFSDPHRISSNAYLEVFIKLETK
jgi:LmbE family N-acetylglucosaminyl deacetylase